MNTSKQHSSKNATASQAPGRKFDLNIEKILEGWETRHALREVLANALDEQALSASSEIQIDKDSDCVWHVRDFGRGLKYEHLTQNENKEKLKHHSKVIGKFGVGLKDALATLYRRGIRVVIESRHAKIQLEMASKHDFTDVTTLHAVICPPLDPQQIGTDFAFTEVSDADMAAAKSFFLRFSGEKVLDTTQYGQILERKAVGPGRIYVKGLLVAEENDFAFSYNITSLTAVMNRALNRERTNVGRTAYADRVKAMLMASDADQVAEILADDLTRMELGTTRDEIKWVDVAVHACQILNARKRVVFVSAQERTLSSDAIDHAISDGYKIVTVPQNIKEKLRGIKDMSGNLVRDLEVYETEFANSFEFAFIDRRDLSPEERRVFDMYDHLAALVGGMPRVVREVRVSETMRPEFASHCDADGLWEPDKRRIIIKRSQLRSREGFAGTFLHELTHARSGCEDVTREFESELTVTLGKASAKAISQR